MSLDTGMPVHFATIAEISSSVTVSRTIESALRSSESFSASASCRSSAGRSEYFSRAAVSYS